MTTQAPTMTPKKRYLRGGGDSLLLPENMAETLKTFTLPQLSKGFILLKESGNSERISIAGFHGDDVNYFCYLKNGVGNAHPALCSQFLQTYVLIQLIAVHTVTSIG